MPIRIWGATLRGVDGRPVAVEVDAGRGLPAFHIVGQGDRVVAESRDRIRAAFRHAGLEFPPGRVTVNLAPSDLPKTGSALDLPIAVAIAGTRIELADERACELLLLGELGLDATLRPVRGALALVAAARAVGAGRAVVPEPNLGEAAICPGLDVFGAASLGEVIAWLRDEGPLARPGPADAARASGPVPDLRDVHGQEGARRALEVAAAGRHNLLMTGPPGSGKTLLARRLPGLLPELDGDEVLEVTRIHGVARAPGESARISRPPFRAPHHTVSDAGMIGGGRPIRPGEVSLAHRGVLFLDELAEFRRPVLEALRQPLEEGSVCIVRADGAVELPAAFQLVAAMNPCPCGFRGDERRDCACDDGAVARYRAKLSGPLLDRIDLHVPVPPVPVREVLPGRRRAPRPEASAAVAARVRRARELQARRYADEPWATNGELPAGALARHSPIDEAGRALVERAVEGLGLSMRAVARVLRVSRTIADLDGSEPVAPAHLAEAIGFRARSD